MPLDVSVVVPVYNTEQYLRECINSLIHQTLKNVEFIFVDDGSTDRSVEIIEEYQTQDDRIKLIRQRNQYAGVARNNGMKQAMGKYIIFLDSDDYFALTLLEDTFRCAEKHQAEIVVFAHYKFDNQTGDLAPVPFRMKRGVFSAEMLRDQVFSTFAVVPWNKFYLRSFIDKHNLEYQPIYKHNDVYFGELAIALADRIVCIKKRLTFYRVNNSASLQGKGTIAYPHLIKCCSALKQSLIEHGKFHGDILVAYNRLVRNSIERRARAKTDVLLSKDFYSAMKKNLIPNLFEAREDFAENIIPRSIYDSTDYENYVFLLIENQKELNENMISKKSKDYLLGHALLAIPRKIKHAIFR